LCSPQP